MFRYSICDPLKSEPLEMGEIEKDQILEVFERFPWKDMLNKMQGVKESDIQFSPSIEFENKATHLGITISMGVDENEFYVFYKRPKMVSKWFGLIKKMDENFLSDRTGQTIADAREAVSALVGGDEITLERKWG